MEEDKRKYNKLLKRYYDGCEYLEKNPENFTRYIDLLMKIKEELENLLIKIENKYGKATEKEILNGFSFEEEK